MSKVRWFGLAVAGLSVVFSAQSQTVSLREDFTSDPAARGWKVFGDTNLFVWDSTNQNLQVTWDSSQSNSYYYHPLGVTLRKEDDFSISFDLCLKDAELGGWGFFELTIGLVSFADATRPEMLRGVGEVGDAGAHNSVEFDYFPPADYGPTISPTVISSNNQFASGFDFYEMAPGDLYHVVMTYSAASQALATVITRNGEAFGPIAEVPLVSHGTNFTDFHVDTLAVCSYNDAESGSSLLAHGAVGNVAVEATARAVTRLAGTFTGTGARQAEFFSHSNWVYTLERTSGLASWTAVSPTIAGTESDVTLQDTNSAAPADKAFYRVRASRP